MLYILPSSAESLTAHLGACLFSTGKTVILVLEVPSSYDQSSWQLVHVILIRILSALPHISCHSSCDSHGIQASKDALQISLLYDTNKKSICYRL